MKIPATIIIFLLLSCLGTNQVQNSTTNSQDNGIFVVAQNQTIEPDNASTEVDLTLWNNITKENVEEACLNQAKNFAGAQSWAVKNCKCDETATDNRKTYSCVIGTMDVTTKYFANIDCFLTDQNCMIQTNYGSQTITFEQLHQLQNQ